MGTLEKHVATCQFTRLPCPKECKNRDGEPNQFMRKDLGDHLTNHCPNRDHQCRYCGEQGTYAAITEVHDKTCDWKIIPCPNAECSDTMQRRAAEEHVDSKCGYTVIACKYESIGCAVKMKRRDMAAHEQDDKLHLHMAMDTTLQLRDTTLQLKNDVARLSSAINILQLTSKMDPQTYKLTNYQHNKQDGGYKQFPPFYTHTGGYHMAFRVYANGNKDSKGTHVSATSYMNIENR